MPIAAAIGVVGSLGSAAIGAVASGSAADKQVAAGQRALDIQRETRDQSRADAQPFIGAGQGAVLSLAQLYGINAGGTGTPGSPNGEPYSPGALEAFSRSPDFAFASKEGMRNLSASDGAAGILNSRGHLNATVGFNQGLATQNFNNYTNRLLALSQLGSASATNSGAQGVQTGQVVGNTMTGIGTAEASGIMGQANALGGGINSATNALATYNLMNRNNSSFAGSNVGYGSSASGWVGNTGSPGWIGVG